MKILLSCRAYPTHRPGGMPFAAQDRARALAAMGHEVLVLTTGHGRAGAARRVDDMGATVQHLRCPTQAYSDQFARECVRAATRFGPDILHVDSFDRTRPWFNERPGRPKCVAITMHGFGPGAFLSAWNLHLAGRSKQPPRFDANAMREERAVLAGADVRIAISRHELWQMQDFFGLPNCRLVYNPIAACFFATPPKPVIPSAPAIIAGNPGTSGPRAFEHARAAAKRAGVPLAEAKGGVARTDMPARYDAARVLLLPTMWAQGFDLTVAEAAARGRPTIASATGSYLRESERDKWIITVPRGDVAGFERALREPLPVVPPNAARRHRPEVHAQRWLEACGV